MATWKANHLLLEHPGFDLVCLILSEGSANNSSDKVIKRESMVKLFQASGTAAAYARFHSTLYSEVLFIFLYMQHTSLFMQFLSLKYDLNFLLSC